MALEVVGSNPTIHPIMNDTLQRVHIVRFRRKSVGFERAEQQTILWIVCLPRRDSADLALPCVHKSVCLCRARTSHRSNGANPTIHPIMNDTPKGVSYTKFAQLRILAQIWQIYQIWTKNAVDFVAKSLMKWYYRLRWIGVSPSGKAPDFDSGIRWFKSSYPCQMTH